MFSCCFFSLLVSLVIFALNNNLVESRVKIKSTCMMFMIFLTLIILMWWLRLYKFNLSIKSYKTSWFVKIEIWISSLFIDERIMTRTKFWKRRSRTRVKLKKMRFEIVNKSSLKWNIFYYQLSFKQIWSLSRSLFSS